MRLTVKIFFVVCLSITTASPVFEPAAETLEVAVETSSVTRIVNGFEVDITQVPYQASLRRRTISGWVHSCGAVIITNRGVLTAAHCANGYQAEPSSLRIVVGTANRQTGGKAYDISQVIVHESFSITTLENDIAILQTAKKITFSRTVSTINFATTDFYLPDGSEALVSGFGATSYEGTVSSVLLATKVQIVNQDTCARTYLRMATITSGMLCAGASDPPRDACQGDSGGPLVANNLLVGIVSWGEGCADRIYPGVYTRISNYSSWIGTIIAKVFD